MAHPANRTTDFAPAWLKLEQNQQRRQDVDQYHNPHPPGLHPHNQSQQPRASGHGGSGINSGSASTQHNNYHQKQLPASSYQQYHSSNHYSSSHHPTHHPQNTQHPHHHPSSNHHHRQAPGSRPQLNSYHSTYNGRVSGPSPASQQQTIHLQRSQSTGSYNDNVARTVVLAPGTPVNNKPLEEEFPQLCGGSSASGPTGSAQSSSQQVNTTAQWRIKERTQEGGSGNKSAKSIHGSDNLLTSNMSGKVYRAQVKPVKRSSIIPITNGASASSSSMAIKRRENGDSLWEGEDEEKAHPMLSSSLDREKKFLQELGWREDAESDEECGIPEQDPAQIQSIKMQAKAAREQLLLKSKQSMKTVHSAIIPNEDDIPSSSSDNSDCE